MKYSCSYFCRLPKNVETRNKWCQWIAKENDCDWKILIGRNLFVCSDHFREEDKGVKKLKGGAVPSISTWPGEERVANVHASLQSNSNLQPEPSTSSVQVDHIDESNNSMDFHNPSTPPPPSDIDIYENYSAVVEINMSCNIDQVTMLLIASIIL